MASLAEHRAELSRVGEAQIDSSKDYGAGDCWGKVRRYTLPQSRITLDSMTCGEYGFTYTSYRFSGQPKLESVLTLKSQSILNDDATAYLFIQSETFLDFNGEIPVSMIRVDTITDYNSREVPIDKEFFIDTLDVSAAYNEAMASYWEMWRRK